MGEEDQRAVVIDTGSHTVKAGFSGDDVPLAVCRSIVGRSKHKCRLRVGCEIKDVYVGEEALANQQKEELYLKYPVKDGQVATENLGGGRFVPLWEDLERLWYHVFYHKLRVPPEEHPVLLTEALAISKAYREKTAQIMFEHFTVPALYLKSQSTLSMFAYGSTNGIVLDSGATSSCVTPIYDGDAVCAVNAIQRIKVGGYHLTEYMMRLLSSGGFSFSTMAEREIARDIKEKLAHVTLDYEADKKAGKESSRGEKSYKLPDGKEIKIGDASFDCPEVRCKFEDECECKG